MRSALTIAAWTLGLPVAVACFVGALGLWFLVWIAATEGLGLSPVLGIIAAPLSLLGLLAGISHVLEGR